MNDVLVTGGCGYIGSVVVQQLAQADDIRHIRVFDNLSTGKWVPPQTVGRTSIELIRGDVRDADTLKRSLRGVDTVFHLAGIVGEKACDKDPDLTLDVNVRSTPTIAEACSATGVSRLVFASTCSVYGMSDGVSIVDESSNANPVSLYGRTKIEAEHSLLEAQQQYGFDLTILRLSTVYGFSQSMRFDLFMNIFVREALRGKPLHVFGGEKWRPILYTIDAARAFEIAGTRSNSSGGARILNAGPDSENFRILEIAEIISGQLPGTCVEMGPPDSDHRSYRVSFKKIREEFGFEAVFPIRKGIDHLVRGLKEEVQPPLKTVP